MTLKEFLGIINMQVRYLQNVKFIKCYGGTNNE